MSYFGCMAWRVVRCCVGAVLVSLVFSGCASQAPVSQDGHEYTDIQPDPDQAPDFPRINTALLQKRQLLLRYRMDGELHQAITLVGPLSGDLLVAPGKILPVRTPWLVADEKWDRLQANAIPVEVRGPEAWRSLLNSSLQDLLPGESGYGACVDILQQKELFLYRDENDTLVSVPIVFKPADVKVARSYEFTHLLAVMVQQLRDQNEAGDRFLLETGDNSKYGYPFVYADTQSGQILFLRREPWDYAYVGSIPLVTTLEMLGQTIVDHVQALFNQPVSSIARLFTMVSSSTADFMRPTSLVLVEHGPIPPLNSGDGMDLVEWEARLDHITGTTTSSGHLTYLVDGVEFFPRMIDVFSTASESVYLRIYIFDNDDYATGIADLLKRRSAEVEVKVLVDGLGTLGAEMANSSSLPPDHEPAWSMARHLEQDSDVRVREVANIWLSGDHTKTIIVDNRVAFLGGMNIGREYRYDWHDMMVEVEGPVVSEISREFHRAWVSSGFLGDLQRLLNLDKRTPVPAGTADYPMRLLYTRPGNSQILRAQIAAIRQARQYIYLQNPYITSDVMLYELVKARRRGVDVRVIMPYRSDSGVISRSNVLAANDMLRNGIRVYIYPGMSHLKAAIYDGWACLGSANMDNLSLRKNREMNLATSHPPAVAALHEQVFQADMENSVELTSPLPHNWSDYLAELLADYL
jgi:cardiolipin synthase